MTAFLTSGHPGTLLARISIFETVASDKLRVVRAKANKLSKSLETLFSMDGGPLTDNVVLSSVQRVLVLNRIAALRARSRAGASRDDSLRLSGASHTAILTKLVRISIFETVASDKLRVE